jgi:acyl dehydratase
VDAAGTLLARLPGGDPLRFHKPVVYQDDGAARREVAGAFAVESLAAKLRWANTTPPGRW